jgi:predicted dehydrogenase
MTAAANPGIRVAVVGCGEFGHNHARVYREIEHAQLAGVFDSDPVRAAAFAQEFQTQTFSSLREMQGQVDAASVAVPTIAHAEVGCRLMELGIDVLVEKPMAKDLTGADALLAAAKEHVRILQVGHVERFNPAVLAVEPILNRPLFFEVHRLGVFTARSLDVDVIYDLMIHDLDILLRAGCEPVIEVKAVGIPVLSDKVDIAHARLEFSGGAVANVTASRVFHRTRPQGPLFSAARICFAGLCTPRCSARQRQAASNSTKCTAEFAFEKLAAAGVEPLRGELEAFLEAVRTRQEPRPTARRGVPRSN